jgi:diaminohydroxyphosphoribosylaminopyrimidine deaminase/5-amino-6-(5-phosphoribosylamino)uracil reductase
MNAIDERWMAEALRLARRGEGMTRPNPPVGAVVVKRGRLLGQGWHRKAGGPHAEVYALRQAGPRARGATLYVTLEPCSSWGRTPPCTEAILRAGIARVVAAVPDPDPRHRGRGFRLLRRAGVEVRLGPGSAAARELLAPFASRVVRRRPLVVLKLAVSLDGKIADRERRSKWITGPAARKAVQDLRRRSDAIVVGAGTARADDPSLLPRPTRGRRPYRVIVDSTGSLPSKAQVLRDGFQGQTILATTARCSAARRNRYEKCGATVWVLPARGGRVDLRVLMRRLAELGALRVLCEGGGELAAGLLETGLADELILFAAPLVLGGAGVGAVGGRGWLLRNAPRFRTVEADRVGSDIMLRARR